MELQEASPDSWKTSNWRGKAWVSPEITSAEGLTAEQHCTILQQNDIEWNREENHLELFREKALP